MGKSFSVTGGDVSTNPFIEHRTSEELRNGHSTNRSSITVERMIQNHKDLDA
jgi:hypothetical protein